MKGWKLMCPFDGEEQLQDIPGQPGGPSLVFPWETRPSIYEHVKVHINAGRNGLTEGGERLPDEETFWQGSKLRWVAGGLDGAFSHHARPKEAEAQVASALDLLREYSSSPSSANTLKIYRWVKQHSLLNYVDFLQDSLRNEKGLNWSRLHDLVRSLALESPDREAVKFGIVILGLFRGQRDKEVFFLLGRHEEFTFYCAVALANTSVSSEDDLWELGQNVHGWGRIRVVRLLAKTQSPRIKNWLLREGYKNSILYEYLAYTCAVTGDLREAIERDEVDDEILNSSGEIIVALIACGPPESMDDYNDGVAVVEAYLTHLAPRASKTKDFLAVNAIKGYLSEKEADWKSRETKGWTREKRMLLLGSCERILSRPAWRDKVLAELKSEDEQLFFDANRAAGFLKLDTWECHWDRLCKSPLTPGRWFDVMKTCNDQRIPEVTALAEKSLPLEQIATGPADEMGLGKQYEAHGCLDYILQELGRFPGHGAALIKVGLRSPVVRNRNMALRALSKWGRDRWPKGMDGLLSDALSKEPDSHTKAWIQKTLDGKSLD